MQRDERWEEDVLRLLKGVEVDDERRGRRRRRNLRKVEAIEGRELKSRFDWKKCIDGAEQVDMVVLMFR